MDNNERILYGKVGNVIKKYRKKHGITQIDLAKKLNITQSLISRWESGSRTIYLEDIIGLFRFFKNDEKFLEEVFRCNDNMVSFKNKEFNHN